MPEREAPAERGKDGKAPDPKKEPSPPPAPAERQSQEEALLKKRLEDLGYL